MNPLIIITRLVLPLSILRWPFLGALVAIWLDNIDWHTKTFLGFSPTGDYQTLDKTLDMYYLALLAVITWKVFKGKFIKKFLFELFIYRFVGFVIFEITRIRATLFFFPNIFENLFFVYYLTKVFAGFEPKISPRVHVLIFTLAAIPKMLQEYSAHIIDKPIEIHFWLIPTNLLQNTTVAILYIIAIAFLFGKWYKSHAAQSHGN